MLEESVGFGRKSELLGIIHHLVSLVLNIAIGALLLEVLLRLFQG